MKPSQLNVVIKITTASGWRREWDMEFRDGAPHWVTLTAYSPENVISMQPAPMRITAEQFFETFQKEWLGSPSQEQSPLDS